MTTGENQFFRSDPLSRPASNKQIVVNSIGTETSRLKQARAKGRLIPEENHEQTY